MTRGRKYLSTSYGEGKELEEQRKSAELFTQAADELAPAPAGPVPPLPCPPPPPKPFRPVLPLKLCWKAHLLSSPLKHPILLEFPLYLLPRHLLRPP